MTRSVPTALVLGVGARADGTAQELSALIRTVLDQHDLALAQVCLMTTLDRRSGHSALLAVAEELAVRIEVFDVETLAALVIPTPSEVVLAHTGTSGVAEAAVLAAGAQLIADKQASDNFTVAVGRHPSVTQRRSPS
jgi:cobalamin biosynthesis protein CbiG